MGGRAAWVSPALPAGRFMRRTSSHPYAGGAGEWFAAPELTAPDVAAEPG
jgi:hypothetical protein